MQKNQHQFVIVFQIGKLELQREISKPDKTFTNKTSRSIYN